MLALVLSMLGLLPSATPLIFTTFPWLNLTQLICINILNTWRQRNRCDCCSTMIWQGNKNELGFSNSIKPALGYIQGKLDCGIIMPYLGGEHTHSGGMLSVKKCCVASGESGGETEIWYLFPAFIFFELLFFDFGIRRGEGTVLHSPHVISHFAERWRKTELIVAQNISSLTDWQERNVENCHTVSCVKW